MAFVHGKSAQVLVAATDLSGYFNSVDVSTNNDIAETTNFGQDAKSYVGGLQDATLSMSGLFSHDTNGSDDGLSAALTAQQTLVTVAIDSGTIGNRAILAKTHETAYSISSPVADVSSITADFQASHDQAGDYGLRFGVMLTDGAAIDSGSVGALASVDQVAATANGGMAFLHVVANTLDAAITITVQDSADDGTFADLGSFSSVGAGSTASEQVVASGTVARYIRVNASTAATSGSITFGVAFARY